MIDLIPADRISIALFAVAGLVCLTVVLVLIATGISRIAEAGRRRKEVRHLERRFADVMDVAADWVWETDPDLRFTYVSRRYFDITGFNPDQILGKTREALRSPGIESDEAWQAHLADMRNRRVFRDFRYSFQDIGGRQRTISLSGKPIYDDDGTFCGYRGTGTDLTETVEAETRAQESERRARQVIDGALDAFIAFDCNGVALDWNHQATRMFGWSREAALGRTLAELIVPSEAWDDHHRMLKRLRNARSQRLLGRLTETEARNSDGTVFPIELTMTATETDGGWVYNAFMRDITERRHYEAALRDAKETAESASRAKSDFLAAMSHELRTPLNAIIGFADLLERHPEMRIDKRVEYAHDIHMSGVHLLELIKEVLDISKVEAGRMQLNEEPVDLVEIGRICLRLVSERARNAGLNLNSDMAPDLPYVIADQQRMKQIVINLLSNAVKFSESGGSVTLAARQYEDDRVMLQVSDTGVGMAPEQIERALEPFTQLEGGYARQHEGTGLGLSLVNKFAEIHNATLLVESEPQVGTTVTVTFPADRARARPKCDEQAGSNDAAALPPARATAVS